MKLFSMVEQNIQEAIDSYIQDDHVLAEQAIQREEEVNEQEQTHPRKLYPALEQRNRIAFRRHPVHRYRIQLGTHQRPRREDRKTYFGDTLPLSKIEPSLDPQNRASPCKCCLECFNP